MSKISSNKTSKLLLEVYYVDDYGNRVPDSWLGQGGCPDEFWNRVEIYEE